MTTKDRARLLTGLAFLSPNIFGVLVFTVFPLVFSIILAFSNWDLRLHNMYKDNPLSFVGFENFTRLFSEGQLSQYLGNTLFLMMGMPLGMSGSLIAAIFLSKKLDGGSRKVSLWMVGFFSTFITISMLVLLGLGASAMTLLVTGCLSIIILLGLTGKQTAYRTFFYTPHFVSGVATFLLWKKLYNPNSGVFTTLLTPILEVIEDMVLALPSGLFTLLSIGGYGVLILTFSFCIKKYRRMWCDGDLGSLSFLVLASFQLAPVATMGLWDQSWGFISLYPIILCLLYLISQISVCYRTKPVEKASPLKGLEQQTIFSLGMMALKFIILGLSVVVLNLPDLASQAPGGLESPKWIADYHWAKPSIMVMGLWAAIGSNSMLLYLAALTNIPQDLYEAADIDGASPMQKFWNVTWPQLAPTTFFIFIMNVIHGLQGGMEMAKTMTGGGPAGSTTTLSYFIYSEGFETGRLGYSSAIAWTLFFLVFIVTMINWRFGNRRTN